MKKTISINIGGIIFHIEEDGYDKLKSYLDSVNKYFSSFEDNQEIISDIENRIAEIFLSKLADGRQTVNIDDVNELIATMGTTKDFDASLELETEKTEATETEAETETEEGPEVESEGYKRLYRDTRRSMLGGVAAGIAHYFRIDPLWIRLLILVLFINIVFVGFSGAILLAYIILWIVLPPNADLPEDKKIKKLYRNSDQRVLGGVASGLASYFGADLAVIRLLFVVSMFLGGAGVLIYIVLWIITPEARTITEKMQMQGEPVTLSNIEENVKKGLKVDEGEESAIVKVLLFPFRLIAMIINGLAKILGPALKLLVEVIRIAFGAILIITGFSLMAGFIVVLFGLSGFTFFQNYMVLGDLPIDLVQKSLSLWVVISTFLVSFIPALALTLLGLVIIVKRAVVNSFVGWSMFALWIIGLLGTAVFVPRLVRDYRVESNVRSERIFEQKEGIPTLFLNELDYDLYEGVQLRLRGHEDSVYQALISTESRGFSRQDAENNAESVTYRINQQKGDFYFDSKITFPEEARFRFQEMDVTFYIPYGQVFRMDRNLDDILVSTLHIHGYRAHQMDGNDWVFEREGLKCLTCEKFNYDNRGSLNRYRPRSYSNGEEISYPFEDFDEVKIASFFDIEIVRDPEYSVVLKGDEQDLDEVYLNQVGSRLEVRFKDKNWKWWKDNFDRKIKVSISMPKLDDLEVIGACDGVVEGFRGEDITISLTGGSDLTMDVNYEDVDITLTGASELDIRGDGRYLEADIVGASNLKSQRYEVDRARVSVIGASRANIYANDEIDIEATGASTVRYSGTNNVSVDESGFSSVKRD